MPASANRSFPMNGDYYGSYVRGGSQELLKYFDTGWNTVLLFISHPADAPPEMDQEFINHGPLSSPLKNWFNVDYGDNSAGNSFATTFAPLTQNAMNSFGVGESTTEVPNYKVPEPNYNGPQTGFYVTPNGTVVPSTGYRAVGNAGADEARNGVIEPRDYPGALYDI